MQTSTPIKPRHQIPPGPDSGYFSPHDSFAVSEAFSFEMLDISIDEESGVLQSALKMSKLPLDFCDLEVNSLTEISDSNYELPVILNSFESSDSPCVRFKSRSAPAAFHDQYSKQALFRPIDKLEDRSGSWNLGFQDSKYSPIDICLGGSRASTPRHQKSTGSTKDVATQTPPRWIPEDHFDNVGTNRGIPAQDECGGKRNCQNHEVYNKSPRAQNHPYLQTNNFQTSHPNPQTQHLLACRDVGRRLAQIGDEINADPHGHRWARSLVKTFWQLSWSWLNGNHLTQQFRSNPSLSGL